MAEFYDRWPANDDFPVDRLFGGDIEDLEPTGGGYDPDDADWNRIGISGGTGKAFSEYEKPTAHVEAAQNANEILGTEFEKGSKPMRVYLRPM